MMASYQPCHAWIQDGEYIVVTEGDSLSAIAIMINIEFNEFIKKCDTNRIIDLDLIYPNQRINCSGIFGLTSTNTINPILDNNDNVIEENKTINAIRDVQKNQEQSNQYLNRISKQLSPISGRIGETNTLIGNGFSSLEEKIEEGPESNIFLGAWKLALSILAATISTLLVSYIITDDMTSNNRNRSR